MEGSGDLGDSPEGGREGSPDTTPVNTSRAGRNLPMAIAVGLFLGAVILVPLFLWRYSFIIIVAAAIAVGTVELARACHKSKGIKASLIPLLVGGQAIIWSSWVWGLPGVLVSFALTVLTCLLWRIAGGSSEYLRDVSVSVFSVGYLPLFGAFAAMLVLPDNGAGRALAFLVGVVASDVGGYAAGALKGKHPMAPTISPKKTWEGFAGSVVLGLVAGALTLPLLLHAHIWQGMIFGVALVLSSTAGDLIESLIKRDLGVKDMSDLLPGHGGIMDRLDSLLPSAVVSWSLLSIFV
jgi:phosphatidate cytidylyltransferase